MWSTWFKYEGRNSLSYIGVGQERHKEAEICPPLLFDVATDTNRKASMRVETNNSNKSPERALGRILKTSKVDE